MFGFKRITKYDEQYLNIKKRFEKWCLEYDERYTFLKNAYNAAQNTDYISLAIKNNKGKKDTATIFEEAMQLQQIELTNLKNDLDNEFINFINNQLKSDSANYHAIFTNIYETEKRIYLGAKAHYKELDIVKFIEDMKEIDQYMRELNIIYSEFLAKEYTLLKQVR